MTIENNNPVANPTMVLREEFDDWAVLFDPDTGNAFGLNPTGVFIWKHLDGKHTQSDILDKLKVNCESVPAEAGEHLKKFVKDLEEKGYVGYELSKN